MISTATGSENLTLTVTQEVHVEASLEDTFAALLEQVGPANEKPDGERMPMKLEAWPGEPGRWWNADQVPASGAGVHSRRDPRGRQQGMEPYS